MSTTPVEAVNAQEQDPKDDVSFRQAVDDLFDGLQYPTCVLAEANRNVAIRTAKIKQINEIGDFIGTFFRSLDQEQVKKLLGLVGDFQRNKILEGATPYGVGTMKMIEDTVSSAGGVIQLIISGVDALKDLIPMFTDMTVEEYEELSMEEGFQVCFHVVGRNYHFFTQRCLPLIRGYIAALAKMKK